MTDHKESLPVMRPKDTLSSNVSFSGGEEWKAPLFCWHSVWIYYWFFSIADNTNAPPVSSASLFPRHPANDMGDVFQ